MAKKQKLDQYYTPDSLAQRFAGELVKYTGVDCVFIEPSAGTGAFLRALDALGASKVEAYDLEPKEPRVVRSDFFQVKGSKAEVAIGNPPFGKGGVLAIQFMNQLVDNGIKWIGFINPSCVGVKHSTLKLLNKNLHLVEEFPVPEEVHYLLETGEYLEGSNSVRSHFQIWEVKDFQRPDFPNEYECGDFWDLRVPNNKYLDSEGKQREIPVSGVSADFVVTSHGKKVGTVYDYEDGVFKANVTRFIKVKPGKSVEVVRNNFENLNLTQYTSRSTIKFNPSISPTEMVHCYDRQFPCSN